MAPTHARLGRHRDLFERADPALTYFLRARSLLPTDPEIVYYLRPGPVGGRGHGRGVRTGRSPWAARTGS